jgi:hypothetical protein
MFFTKFKKSGLKNRDKILGAILFYILLPIICVIFFPIWYALKVYNRKCKNSVPYYKLSDQDIKSQKDSSFKCKMKLIALLIYFAVFMISPLLIIPFILGSIIFFVMNENNVKRPIKIVDE